MNLEHQGDSLHPRWLKARYALDEAARNAGLTKIVARRYEGQQSIHVLDVGSGLGANVLHLAGMFGNCELEWTLLDSDSGFKFASQKHLQKALPELGWKLEKEETDRSEWVSVPSVFSGRTNTEQSDGPQVEKKRRLKIRSRTGSLMHFEFWPEKIELVTANAVFDLFSRAQFIRFSKLLRQSGAGLYATLNYHSMHFEPETQEDRGFIEAYEKHMTRDPGEQKKMGPNCIDQMCSVLLEIGLIPTVSQSNWVVDAKNTEAVKLLFGFMNDSIPTMPGINPVQFRDWSQRRQNDLREGRASLKVCHHDLQAHSWPSSMVVLGGKRHQKFSC